MSRRYDVQAAEGPAAALHDYRGYGLVQAAGYTTPTNGVVGYAPGCLWHNLKGGPGTSLYVNLGGNGFGTNTTAQWYNIETGGASDLVTLTGATTITPLLHAGKTIILNAAAGFTVTLPTASGSGNTYRFFVGTTVTSVGDIIDAKVNGSEVISGIAVQSGASGAATAWSTASNTNKITLNGTTTGGILGDIIELQDVALNQWSLVQLLSTITGTAATPFGNH
jgi:hypothetical protein